jgi:Spy/CpxP family protein refolding chaperone
MKEAAETFMSFFYGDKNMNFKHICTYLFAMIVLPAGFALAQPAQGGHGPGGPGGPNGPGCPGGPCGMAPATQPAQNMLTMFDRVAKMLSKQLGLTDEQKTKFDAMIKTNRAELADIVKKLEAQREKFDKDLDAILTPEQKEKLANIKERRENMMKRMGGGGEGLGAVMKAVKELKLPADQEAKVNDILTQAKTKFKAAKGDRDARQEIMKDMMTQLNKVLTGEEMDQLRACMRDQMGGPRGPGMAPGMGKGHGGRMGHGMGHRPDQDSSDDSAQ